MRMMQCRGEGRAFHKALNHYLYITLLWETPAERAANERALAQAAADGFITGWRALGADGAQALFPAGRDLADSPLIITGTALQTERMVRYLTAAGLERDDILTSLPLSPLMQTMPTAALDHILAFAGLLQPAAPARGQAQPLLAEADA